MKRMTHAGSRDSIDEVNQMPVEAILAAVAFVALFTMWVILPGKLRARHEAAARALESGEE